MTYNSRNVCLLVSRLYNTFILKFVHEHYILLVTEFEISGPWSSTKVTKIIKLHIQR
jgi:hypothetical protein